MEGSINDCTHSPALSLVHMKTWIVPIPGTRNMDHLNENLPSVHVEVTLADLRETEDALSAIRVHGGRMHKEQMKIVNH